MFCKGYSETLIKSMTSRKHLFKSDKTTITKFKAQKCETLILILMIHTFYCLFVRYDYHGLAHFLVTIKFPPIMN